MDTSTVDLHLQKIEEFVHDEGKIVTFKWLSTNLGISASDSKRLLEQYVTDQRNLKPDVLAVTYSLSGELEDGTVCVTVVKGDQLEDKKDLFTKVMGQEIYSVQKSKDVDLNTVSLVDYFDMHSAQESPVTGSIISKNCIKRVFKAKKALPPPRQPEIKGKMAMFTKVPPKSSEKIDTITASPKQSNSTKGMTNSKPKQNGSGIASFFNKNAATAETKAKSQEHSTKKEHVKLEEQVVVKEKATVSKTSNDRIKSLVDSDSDTEGSGGQTQQSLKSKENKKPKKTNKRPRKDNKKSAPSPKRRKRIVEQEDSDDDIFGNDDEESAHENIKDESEEDSEPVLKPTPSLAPKNKKRKLVDRTYTDEDGYVITNKEWMEESPSEDEEMNKSRAEAPKSDSELTKSGSEAAAKSQTKRKVDEIENSNESKKSRKSASDSSIENANESKKSRKSASDSSVEKATNGRAKGAKGKKAVAANQPTLMNFFKRS